MQATSSAMPMPIGASSNSVEKSRARRCASRASRSTASRAATSSSLRRRASAAAESACDRARLNRPASTDTPAPAATYSASPTSSNFSSCDGAWLWTTTISPASGPSTVASSPGPCPASAVATSTAGRYSAEGSRSIASVCSRPSPMTDAMTTEATAMP